MFSYDIVPHTASYIIILWRGKCPYRHYFPRDIGSHERQKWKVTIVGALNVEPRYNVPAARISALTWEHHIKLSMQPRLSSNWLQGLASIILSAIGVRYFRSLSLNPYQVQLQWSWWATQWTSQRWNQREGVRVRFRIHKQPLKHVRAVPLCR